MYVLIKSLLLLIFLFFFIYPQFAVSEEKKDTCLKLYLPNEPDKDMYNPDSVMADTCNQINKNLLYAKHWFFIILPPKVLNIPEFNRDTIIERNWRDIDSSFINLRYGFFNVEKIFGNFILRKIAPDIIDTNSYGSRSFEIRFNNYVNIDSVQYFLQNIPNTFHALYDMRVKDLRSNLSENDIKLINKFELIPNPSNYNLNITFNINSASKIKINIINILGKKVIEYINSQIFEIGENTINLDLTELKSDVYFCQIICDQFITTKKIFIIK